MAIVNMLDLSTGNMPEPCPDFGDLEVWHRKYGYLIPVVTGECPKWLTPIMEYAYQEGCYYICFEMDAPCDERFPEYEW